MLIYQIKSNKTGLYSNGGTSPSFGKKGKVWRTLGYLKNHLNQLSSSGHKIYQNNDCEVVILEVVETVKEVKPYMEVWAEVSAVKATKEQARQDRIAEYQKNVRLKEYEKLKQEFEQ